MSISDSLKIAQTWRLFSRTEDALTPFEVAKWWEVRRIPYNLIVGVTGVVTALICTFLCYIASRMTPAPFAFPNPPPFVAFAVVGYGVMANVCYTGGWLAELLAREMLGERANYFGQASIGCLEACAGRAVGLDAPTGEERPMNALLLTGADKPSARTKRRNRSFRRAGLPPVQTREPAGAVQLNGRRLKIWVNSWTFKPR